MSTNGPMRYTDPYYHVGTFGPGNDVLNSTSSVIRPRIGGVRVLKRVQKSRRSNRSNRSNRSKHSNRSRLRYSRKNGGFIPTIMEPFVTSASKYIVPIALYSGYKLITNHTKTKTKTKKRKLRK